MTIEIRERIIAREFSKYIRRSGYTVKTLAAHLRTILRKWVALESRCAQFKIDELTPAEWCTIEENIVASYQARWQQKAKDTRRKNTDRKKREADNAKQLPLDL